MQAVIEGLNRVGAQASVFAWSMFWQSSLLIGVMFVVEWALRRRVRAAVRYALWWVVLLKLVLPPSLALPTGPVWWLRPSTPRPAPTHTVLAHYGPELTAPSLPPTPLVLSVSPAPERLSVVGAALAGTAGVSLALLIWMLVRWRHAARVVRASIEPPAWVERLLDENRRGLGLGRPLRLRLLEQAISPAVCGLFRPVILVPKVLVERLSPAQLRSVLLHELVHLRRGDVWANCCQALLQAAYWWHPLLWLANARMRRVREEAVDDAVVLALRDKAEAYAATLLEVAKLALQRPLATLGLVGILESRSFLRQRIERLLELRPARHAGLSFASVLCVLAFGAFALPMGQAPEKQREPGAATVLTATNAAEPLLNRIYQVNPGTFLSEFKRQTGFPRVDESSGRVTGAGHLADFTPQTNGSPSNESSTSVSALRSFCQNLGIDMSQPKSIFLNEDAGVLFVRAFAHDHELLEKEIQSLNAGKAAATKVRTNEASAVRTNSIPTSKGPRMIMDRLNRIRLGAVAFQDLPLGEVARLLTEQVRKQDPEGKGVLFTIRTNVTPAEASGAKDVADVRIGITPPMLEARLVDVLDAIVRSADSPLKWTVLDDGVAFSAKTGNELPPLYTRIIKVDPNAFVSGLRNALGLTGLTDTKTVQQNVRDFFNSVGVDLAPPKTIFFNDREGAILVRGTLQDLDTIETAVQVLNIAPPQIHLKATLWELPEESLAGFWNNLGITNTVATTNTGWILTPVQARSARTFAEASAGADLLNGASVTTLSGRQTQIQVVDLRTIVTNINPQALKAPGVPANGVGTNALYLSDILPLGPTLDVMPYVRADCFTVQLTAIATVSEFLGYDQPTNSPNVYVDGKKQRGELPLPRFRVRSVSNSAILCDGQTVLLSGSSAETITRLKQKTPVLGDIPGVGSLFRSESTTRAKKRLLVLITPTLIDPAGNRLHTDQEVEKMAEGRIPR